MRLRRRPAQALYQPPRRSQNPESPKPVPTSPPVTVTEDIESVNTVPKATKTKTARPSAEPYVPPSRRSQTSNKESIPPVSSVTTEKKKKESDTQEDEEEDDWETLLDNNNIPSHTNAVEEVIFTKLS